MKWTIASFLLTLFLVLPATAQIIIKPFQPRYHSQQRGGIAYVSNNILSCNGCQAVTQSPPGGLSDNNDFNARYIDIDGSAETFSSSSADLNLPSCSSVTFAGLYWGGAASSTNSRLLKKNQVKLKLPGAANYTDLTGDVNFGVFENRHYQYFKDITSLFTKGGATNGTYTVGNVVADDGRSDSEAGWTLVVVYRQDLQPLRDLTVFDGFAGIPVDAPDLKLDLSGFLTPPTGPVSFELGFVAYEGDRKRSGDYLLFNNTRVSDASHTNTNTFNSSITKDGTVVTSRNPAHSNTLGYDASIMVPANGSYQFLTNSATAASITLGTKEDRYAIGVVTTAIDVYNPYFQFTHQFQNLSGNSAVAPGDDVLFEYEMTNIGLDGSTGSTFIDSLPPSFEYTINTLEVQYNNGTWIKYTDAAGDDEAEFVQNSHTVLFRLGKNVSTKGGTLEPGANVKIRYRARLTADCDLLRCAGGSVSKYGHLSFSGNINKENSWQVNSTPKPASGECTASGPLNIPLRIPASCLSLPSDRDFTIDCETNVSEFNLPTGYELYSVDDPSFSSPLATVSVSGTYKARRLLASGCDYVFSVHVLVNKVKILSHPRSAVACAAGEASFSVSAAGSGNFFRWQKFGDGNWYDIAGATDSILILSNVEEGLSGSKYRAVVSRSCGPGEISSEATLTVNSAVKITQQVSSATVCVGSDVKFSVGAAGSALSYQWQVIKGTGWSNVVGATADSLVISSVTAYQNGARYRVVITSTCGILTSEEAVLTVNSQAQIIKQPASATVCEGSEAAFFVKASGTGISYQWQNNNANGEWRDLAGATADSLVVSATSTALNGMRYRVVISGTCGQVISSEVSLSVDAQVVIIKQPQAIVVCDGSPATFSVDAQGKNLRYQWQRKAGNNTWLDVSNATTRSYTVESTVFSDNNVQYRVLIISDCGLVTSNNGLLIVRPKLQILNDPKPVAVCEGVEATFAVEARGDSLQYQWQTSQGSAGWIDIAGARTATLFIPRTTGAQKNSRFRVLVSDRCGSLTSAEASLTIKSRVQIVKHPQSLAVCEGADAKFAVEAQGEGITYQWQVDSVGAGWSNISGATQAAFTVGRVSHGERPVQYRVIVSSACDTLASMPAVLTVDQKPFVSRNPLSQAICEGSDGVLSVAANGANLSYQWQVNKGESGWNNIAGATAPILSLKAITAGQNGYQYRVVVKGSCGSITSASATLTVERKVQLVKQPVSVTICEGAEAILGVEATGKVLNYQWQVNDGGSEWNNLDGSTARTLTLSAVSSAQNGYYYRVIVSGSCGSITSEKAFVWAQKCTSNPEAEKPEIVAQPHSLAVCVGDPVIFSVQARGGDLRYQWQTRDLSGAWTDLPNQKSADLRFAAASQAQNGAKFRVLITSGAVALESAELTLSVNTAPNAHADIFQVNPGVTLLDRVDKNDRDADDDPLSYSITSPVEHGTWTLNSNGSFTFIPEAGWTGSTRGTYVVSDGKCSSSAEVTFNVSQSLQPPVSSDDDNGPALSPSAKDDSFQTDMESRLSGSVALNDVIVQEDHPIFSATSAPAHGTLVFSADGTFVYIPSKDFSGTDTFNYRVCDAAGLCSSAKVEIKVIPFTLVQLSPAVSTIREGGKAVVTATLSRPYEQDVTIKVSYKGKAIRGKDYDLSDQFETLRIRKGQVSTTDKISVFAVVDSEEEETEDINIEILPLSNPNIRIGVGAQVLISGAQESPVVSAPGDSGIPSDTQIQPQPLVSPNGDYSNDYFQIRNIERYPNNEVVIFNRWGNEVFRVKGYNEGSGNVFKGIANRGLTIGNNESLPDGVYFYIVTPDTKKAMQSAELIKGYLILKRG